ncbi:MAG: hypothetical protein ACI4C4_01105 [Lachnospiraceae bacterium]
MDNKIKREHILFLGLFSLGIMLRYIVMTFGFNFDFESYCIVGEISGNFRNVYEETTRYNYGPIFLCIQGILYRISQVLPGDWVLVYRVLIVTVLTLADLGIAAFIARRYSYIKALLFFLNPVSIIITGYHNQFDNIAVLFALLSTIFFNDEKELNKKDIGFVVLFSLSLITKHILFLLPIFILLMGKLSIRKRVLYAFVPPAIFLLSFLPFALSSNAAFQGIVNNVFRYRSVNNAPFFEILYILIDFPLKPRIIVYGIIMIVVAWFVRKLQFDHIMLIYLIAMVAFSSAIVNQYLVIPMAALCVLNVGKWNKIYMLAIVLHLILDWNGLGELGRIQAYFPGTIFETLARMYVRGGYILAAWILFFALVHLIRCQRKLSK